MKIRPETGDRKPWHTDEYVAYLASDEWAAVRRAALDRAGHRCESVHVLHRVMREEGDTAWTEDHATRCPNVAGLEVHHKHYRSLGAEAWGDLEALCPDCHEAADRRRRAARGRRR